MPDTDQPATGQPASGGSRHRHRAHGFRPDPADWDAASAQLEAAGHTTGTYLRACLAFAARDPQGALTALAPYWPGPRTRGRPRQDTAADSGQDSGS